MTEQYECRTIAEGRGEGDVLVSEEPISFYGAVDIDTGTFIEEGHQLEGETIAGKVLIFPKGKGSTVGSYVLYGMAQMGTAPVGIITHETETIVATGAILGEIPCVDHVEDAVSIFETGDRVVVDASNGVVEVLERGE